MVLYKKKKKVVQFSKILNSLIHKVHHKLYLAINNKTKFERLFLFGAILDTRIKNRLVNPAVRHNLVLPSAVYNYVKPIAFFVFFPFLIVCIVQNWLYRAIIYTVYRMTTELNTKFNNMFVDCCARTRSCEACSVGK